MPHVFYITFIYFIIGAIATLLANKGKEEEIRKQRWIKYATYFIIVHGIVLLLLYKPSFFIYLALLIVIIGYFEMYRVGIHKNKNGILAIGLLVYAIISTGFLLESNNYYSSGILLQIYILVFAFDGFSQITGQLFGRRKLTPNISPGKTVEGLLGGTIAGIITCYILYYRSFSLLFILILSLAVSASALCGDLAASWYKRKMEVKDFSRLIPGHGGVLDRFDSFMTAICFGLVFWLIVNLISPTA